jgi:hypothetical protein
LLQGELFVRKVRGYRPAPEREEAGSKPNRTHNKRLRWYLVRCPQANFQQGVSNERPRRPRGSCLYRHPERRKELQQYMPVGATALVERTANASVTDYYS